MIPDFIALELYAPYGPDVLRKLGKIEEYYKIYEDGARFETDDSGDYIPAELRSHQIKQLIRREAQFMFGKTPTFRVGCPDEAKIDGKRTNESAMQDYLDAVLKKNRMPDKLIKGERDCAIGGRVALKVNVSPEKCGITFVPADGFVYKTSIDDVDTLEQITFFYTTKDDPDKARQEIWVQKYWMDGEICKVSEYFTDGYGKKIEWQGSHKNENTGLNRIPAYIILNDGLSGDTDGESEVKELMVDDSWYGRLKSANIDSLRKGMNQIVWMYGASPESGQDFRYAPGALWDIKGDPAQAGPNSNAANVQVGTIENSFSYAGAYQNTLANIKQDMHDLLGVPDLNLESTRSLITSGKGLKALYWPLICRCEEKMNAWRPALEWLAELLIYAAEVFPGLRKTYGEFSPTPHNITIESQYPLPEDEADEKELDLSEIGNHARSVRSYLMKWGGPDSKGLEVDEADAELEQIAQERRMLEDSYISDELETSTEDE